MGKIINFQDAKQALLLNAVKRQIIQENQEPVLAPKKAVVVSALPGEVLPPEYPDLRPLLQRDGLILLSWAKWNNRPPYGLCYRVNWVKSCGQMRRYCSSFYYDFKDIKNEDEFKGIMPCQNGDYKWEEGIAGSRVWYSPDDMADIVFLAAPKLNFAPRDSFIQKLKEAGIKVNFDYEFSLGKAREITFKKEEEKIEALDVSKTINPHAAAGGNIAGGE
jgi:hypothetical protein